MPDVTITSSVTTEQVAAVLRDQLGPSKVQLSTKEADTINVHKNLYQRARVRLHPTGGGTSAHVGASAIRPIGFLFSILFAKHVARAIEDAPQLRATA